MHFTMDVPEASSAVADTRRSFNTLRSHAHALATLSASFSGEAKEATASYRAALDGGSLEEWSRFVTACSALALHGQAVETLLPLSDGERNAWRYFRQIADENADLRR
jgi:hypothetical protein